MNVISAEDAGAERWDAVVVGTGMGGSTLGYALARAGWRVLFCEQGRCSAPPGGFLEGRYAETFLPGARVPTVSDHETLRRAGRSVMTITDDLEMSQRDFIPFIGAGPGGSSALYGMAMERFFPEDFQPSRNHPADCGADWQEDWPIAYEELEPFYSAAEELYGVRGERDPLRLAPAPMALPAPPPPSAHAEELRRAFSARGLNPYRLPLACRWVPECDNCQGFLCPRNCKQDGATACLKPAVEQWGAALVEECEVLSVSADRREAQGVRCQVKGKIFEIRARNVVVAAGGLGSPALLLRSASEYWPQGLANESGRVGRNLMRHLIDLYAIRTAADPGPSNGRKELAFNDFYIGSTGEKLGGVQSFGRLPPAEVMYSALRADVAAGRSSWLAPFVTLLRGPLSRALDRIATRYVVFAATVEDIPRLENRVSVGDRPGRVMLRYRVSPYDRMRADAMRHRLRDCFKGLSWREIRQSENNQRIAHVCGTCRSGITPSVSVVDANCRSHGVGNLFVVDASVFPSSGGTNPSLTIAALALRVASRLGCAVAHDPAVDAGDALGEGGGGVRAESRARPLT